MELFLHTHFSSAIVLDKMGGAIGRLHLDDLKRYVESRYLYNVLIASEVMDEKIPYLLRGDSLSKSFEIMNKDQIDIVPVMESANELKPIGYISRQDVLDVYHKQIMQKNMSGMRIKSPIAALSNQHLDKDISLNPGYEVKKIPVPNGFIGQTLSGLQMRSKYGLTVLTILNDKSRDHIIPEPGYCFQVGDIMVVGGSLESIAKLDKNRN